MNAGSLAYSRLAGSRRVRGWTSVSIGVDGDFRKQQERATYDREANRERPAFASLWDRALYREMLEHRLAPNVESWSREYLTGRKVLILGAGNADVLHVERFTRDIVAINLSAHAVQGLRQEFPNYRCDVADAENLTTTERYGAIYCHSILHHLHPIDRVLDNLSQLLNPGGVLFIAAEPGLYNPPAALARRIAPSQSHTPGERAFVFSRLQATLSLRFFRLEAGYYFLGSMLWPYLARRVPRLRAVLRQAMRASLAIEARLVRLPALADWHWMFAGVYQRR